MSDPTANPVDSSTALPGSRRDRVVGHAVLGPVSADAPVDVTVVVRRRAPLPPDPPRLQREELAERYGADPADLDAVTAALTAVGAEVLERDAGSRRVRARGPAAALAALFGTALTRVDADGVQFRQREGDLGVPADLVGVVVAVLGLDDRPQARAHLRTVAPAAVRRSFTPPALGAVYAFPEGTDGSGQTLAIIELGGGYDEAELQRYFRGLGLSAPMVEAVGVDGGANVPGADPQGADGEVLLDLEVAGALAPGARLVTYFAPNTDAGFLDAVSTAVHAEPTPAAVSISWGQSEDAWTGQARGALDAAMADGAALGVTVCVAAGDNGSADSPGARGVHVDFPAASPHALACGGTTRTGDAEVVWGDGGSRGATGGGVSDTFPLPSWQQGVGVPIRAAPGGRPGRGVPDVAAVADPATGYEVLVDGSRLVIGGTSAVAPLWAALVCRLAQALGRPLGLLQPQVYAGAVAGRTVPGFRDITAGSNGAYTAGPGWDACTGLGVPNGTALLHRLRSAH